MTALNSATKAFLGADTVSVRDLRQLKADQAKAFETALPDNLPDDAVGSVGVTSQLVQSSSSRGGFVLIGVGVFVIAGAAFLLGRITRSRKA